MRHSFGGWYYCDNFERLIWRWYREQQRLSPGSFNEFGWIVTGRVSRGLCSTGIINAPTALFNAPGMPWISALLFQKVVCSWKEAGVIRLTQDAWYPYSINWPAFIIIDSARPWCFPFFFDNPSFFSNETLMPLALLSGSSNVTKGINVVSRKTNLNVEHQESRLYNNSYYICACQHRL